MLEIPGNFTSAGNITSPADNVISTENIPDSGPGLESASDTFSQASAAPGSELLVAPFPKLEPKTDKIMGVGYTEEYTPVSFKVVRLEHAGNWYEITFPAKWRFFHGSNYIIVYNPCDKNICVCFTWDSGAGKMDPKALIERMVNHNGIKDYEVLNATTPEVIGTPPGKTQKMEQEATYTFRGQKCHHHVIATVRDTDDPYYLFWSGTMIWRQAPDEIWDEYNNALYKIASSFTRIKHPKPQDLDYNCGCGHGPACGCGHGSGYNHGCYYSFIHRISG